MILFWRFLRDRRRSLVGWSVGMAALVGTYLPFYPLMGGPDLERIMAQLPAPLLSLLGLAGPLDGVGYAGSTIFGLLGAFLLVFAAVSWGTASVAGDEASGQLELTLTYPLTRTRLLLERAGAVALLTLCLASVATFSTLLFARPSGISIMTVNALSAGAAFYLLGLFFAYLALAVGAATGRANLANALTGTLAIAAYLADSLTREVARLSWLAPLSPFNWALSNEPLRNGASVQALVMLAVVSVLFVAFSLPFFLRRDVGAN